jgi:hypothetical protein
MQYDGTKRGEDREYWPSAPERKDDTRLSIKVILRLNKQRFWRGEQHVRK